MNKMREIPALPNIGRNAFPVTLVFILALCVMRGDKGERGEVGLGVDD